MRGRATPMVLRLAVVLATLAATAGTGVAVSVSALPMQNPALGVSLGQGWLFGRAGSARRRSPPPPRVSAGGRLRYETSLRRSPR
jgi:hypothetical protein